MTPLVLVIGFLGSGKTTFLKEVAAPLRAKGLSPGFIINDYQNAGVDTEQLRALGMDAAAISGDCVCCGSREELVGALAGFEHGEARVAIVEANGTSDSEQLIEMLALEPDLAGFSDPLQVSLVDAKRWQKRFWHNALEREQVRTATHICITRSEEAGESRVQEVERSLNQLGVRVPRVTPGAFAEILTEVVEEVKALPPRLVHSHHHPHHHEESDHEARHHFASTEIALPERVGLKSFSKFLRDLPPTVLRAKGLVRFTDSPDEFFVFQKVDGFEEPQFFPVGANPRINYPLALFIGPEIDGGELAARLARSEVVPR